MSIETEMSADALLVAAKAALVAQMSNRSRTSVMLLEAIVRYERARAADELDGEKAYVAWQSKQNEEPLRPDEKTQEPEFVSLDKLRENGLL